MLKRSLVTLLALMACDAVAQDRRSDIATQAEISTLSFSPTPRADEFSTEADADLGEQRVLSQNDNKLGASILAETGLYYTSNAFLSQGSRKGDMFFLSRAGANLNPHVAGGLFANAYFRQDIFLYNRYTELSFLSTNAGAGFSYVIHSLGDLTLMANYNFTRMLNVSSLDQFYTNHSLNFGAFKEFRISDNQAIQFGWTSSFSVTALPSYARRNEHNFWSGYRIRLLDPLEFQFFYLLALFDYTNESRVDATQFVGGNFLISLTSWATLTAGTTFSANNSTRSQFDYTAVNLGGTLGLNIRF